MENKYADIFINAWYTVLESFSSKPIMLAEVHPSKTPADNQDILVLMGVIGDVNGQVILSMNVKTGQALASEMLGGMEVTDQDELVTSAIGEICNMIMGNACLHIASTDTGVDITPPTIICNQTFPQPPISPSYKISLYLENLDEIDFNVEIV
ncbi:chemotaxis protein CheX [Faecalicatena contorta]|uniref:Chemotaxis protein CheX n=1 Tax=Faecalicatena contorta TaxID=39482 RepID=A0A315ZX90_9FIRM|nr:chemotaxis protein CheX [Faecalicatena contorta]PWJ49510.1 chemotaxis protein CheX [Faecalicatena contorta]SUQ14754.1 chemotaxis protein CheX [Faecalicatena contorta]